MNRSHDRFLLVLWVIPIVGIIGIFLYIKNYFLVSFSPDPIMINALSGGETTIFNTSRYAFTKPLANLPHDMLRQFAFGNNIFKTNWTEAPASVTSLDGLGPTFNRISCAACHANNGRGKPPDTRDEPLKSIILRLSIPGKTEDGAPLPHPSYGNQLNPLGIYGVTGEGKATVLYEEILGTYVDGTPYSLRKPTYKIYDTAFGELHQETMLSPRVAPMIHGLGLLEAIPEKTILSLADPYDKNKDGISGRPNYVPNIEKKKVIGRFGWKANVATLKQQNADAAAGDIGLTTTLHPLANCPAPQKKCNEAISGGNPEMSDQQLSALEFYSQTLAPPARRDIKNRQVQLGGELFEKIQCSSCHIPVIQTGKHTLPQLSHQTIQPFTDLLLHDMGKDLADHRPDFEANGQEWRTAPLWGIGLIKRVNQHTYFLHDGRARNLEEAILWHGGEAYESKEAFRKMTKKERHALLIFLNSL